MDLPRTWGAVALALALTAPADASATEIGQGGHPFGLGLTIGYPSTGISGKYYLGGRRNAIEGVIATWSDRWAYGGWYLHGVYMWHPSVLARESGFELPWHIGVGGFVADGYRGGRRFWYQDETVGVRVPIGLDFDLTDIRLQFSGDLAAHVGLIPTIYVDLAVNISARYYF